MKTAFIAKVLLVGISSMSWSTPVLAKDTLGLTIDGDGVQLRAIGFGMGKRDIPSGPLDIAFHLRRETWQGRTGLQLQLCDFRAASGE